MSPEEFLREFGHLAETEGGMSHLRSVVRQLGVMGRLVGQDSGDEPAAALVQKAREYRLQILGRKAKPVPDVVDSELPFEIPYSWEWVRLGDLTWRSQYGTSQKAHADDSGIPILRMGNIVDGVLDYTSMKFVPESTEGISDLLLQEGDLVFNRTNSFEQVGKMAVFHEQERPTTLASYLIRISLCPGVVPEYANIYFGTPACRLTQIEPGITQQTNQANFNGTKLAAVLIPLPPLPEQKRIVEKVDQLMALCDELEAKQKQKRAKAVSLNNAALSAVVHAPDKSKLKSSWSRVQDHFEVLYELPENVKELRQTILQLAVMGKLTKPPVGSELVISQAQQWAHSKVRDLSSDRASPPDGWKTVRLGWLVDDVRYGTSKKCARDAALNPVLRIPNVAGGVLSLDDLKYAALEPDELAALALEAGDLLVVRSNGSQDIVGRPAVVTSEAKGMAFAGYLIRLRLLDGIEPQFVKICLDSPRCRLQVTGALRTTSGVKNVNSSELLNLVMDVPPREVQLEAVFKVEQLMALCDDLEAKLAEHRGQGQRLMQAVVEGLVA